MQGKKFQGSLTSLKCEYCADTMRSIDIIEMGETHIDIVLVWMNEHEHAQSI